MKLVRINFFGTWKKLFKERVVLIFQWLVISLGLAALSLCADAASLPVIIRKRQIDSPSNFVRRVVGSPLRPRSGRSGIVQQRTSNVVTSAVPTVNFVQEVTPVLRFQVNIKI